ncbi:tRNA (5-methylaminomethyl-2-thiouridine)(34)-methyltransferase MnmD [Pseudovibrio exalbescens]|uniref:tRNA (5-methylaminomethyl-2-thiouridine)(34)-methyltransferase MnmD n=1 Tax=Pseudovibrio exalbescens TaxID=197461 RepID=UPI0023651B2A|nr:tRNA (5-methylaminomethyl-2-thiouridine)(34)-methyltransferase MnmD [Pseudovibrio exalbescens]MDD7909358.1 tRNA (5-methylaminomethyl-2-thiouridine)(34)-methyltransferase MnmD [Pseudovibrio exalbescens]
MTEKAELEWRNEDVPFSSRFDDTYFSKAGGREETNYVFVQGNGLEQRMTQVSSLVVAELGFGSGLNFYETVLHLRRLPKDTRPELTFISFELYPMAEDEIRKTIRPWPELMPVAEEVLCHWQLTQGWMEVALEDVTLCLGVGDANELIKTMPKAADAWYLDGFNPSKNPELWSEELLRAVFDQTNEQGTFATYTAAGWVRRNLQAAGFAVERAKGFGTKREMLKGRKIAGPSS